MPNSRFDRLMSTGYFHWSILGSASRQKVRDSCGVRDALDREPGARGLSHDGIAFLKSGITSSKDRAAAALTQEELAERAEISVRAVSDLERGANTTPRPYTVRRLADALKLSPEDSRAVPTDRIRSARDGGAAPGSLALGRFLGSLPEWS